MGESNRSRSRSRSRDRDRRRDDRDSHRSRGGDSRDRGRGRDDRDRRDDRGRGRDSDRGGGRDSRDGGRGRDNRDGRDDRDRREPDRRDRDDDRSRGADRGSTQERRQSPARAEVTREEVPQKSDVPDWVRDLVEEPRPPPLPASAMPPQMQMAPPSGPPGINPGARTVIVPQQFVSKVLGFGGCTVNEIQLKTKTYIKMNQDTRPQGYSTAIITSTLYNDQEALDKAEAMIRERIDSGMSAQTNFHKGGGKSTPLPVAMSTFATFTPPVSGILPPGALPPGADAMGWPGASASSTQMMGGGSFL